MDDTLKPSLLQPAILSLGTSLPHDRYSQEEIYAMASTYSEIYRNPRVRQLFMNSDIDFRHLYLKREDLKGIESSDELHARFRRGAVDIGAKAVSSSLAQCGLVAADIDFLVVATCTGYLCPGLSAILIKELGFRNDVQRADLVGMGCAGAMPALQRGYDYVKAHPENKALVLTVEICSACYYLDDSLETMVGTAICADGAAAVVVGMSDEKTVPRIAGFKTRLESSLLESVGFEQREGKLRIILSKDIRDLAGGLAGKLINGMLQEHHLGQEEISHWIIHSGGRKVIDTIQEELHLTDAQVRHSRHVLKFFGNMSSPTVLFVLQETMIDPGGGPKAGDVGVMLAMGPGLAVEGAVLRW
jgi:polyketide synthase Type III